LPIHLHPTAQLAPRVLLPGDPGRALALATALLADDRRMFNHNRGLWGYSGTAADGELLTIQATGMGGPSAAIVLEELVDLGVQRAVRIGTCGALDPSLALGALVTAEEIVCADGASRALGADERERCDAVLTTALAAHSARTGLIVSTDLFYDPDPARQEAWRAAGALAVEMEAAALAAVARLRGVAFGCLLAVSDLLDGGRQRIGDEGLEAAGLALGEAAVLALADPRP
jgi:uridine phosphorylase